MPEHVTGDADALAAEYVLGTLDFDERSAAESLRAQDAEFAAKVKVWERRLGELHLMVEPVDPDPDIWQRIKAKLPALPRPQPAIPVPELKPEPEPDRVPERQAQLTPSEPTPIAPQLAEAGSGESEHSRIEPGQTGAAGPEAQTEPPVAPASDVPITTDAPPAAPDAPPAPASWQAAPSEAPAALQSTESFDISAAAASAIADALAAPESPSSPVVGPSMTRAEPEDKFRIARRHLAIWRTAAVVMGLVVVGLATLVCLWRYWPERVPTELRPLQLMRFVGIAVDTSVPRRKPAPPESRFDE